MEEMSEREREALQAEHDKELAEQRMAQSDQLAQNEADNYARLHGAPVEEDELETTEEQDEEDGE